MSSAERASPSLPEVTLSEAGGVRYLHLGTSWVQGAMRPRAPLVVELEYVQRMLAALLWLDPAVWDRPGGKAGDADGRRAVQLGLGAGALTRFTHRALHMATTAVELNPQVIEVNHAWFRVPRSAPGLELVEADAGPWVAQAPPRSATLLHIDLYDDDAAAPVLDDAGFYAACRRLLADDGVLAVNLFGRDAQFDRSLARLAAVFGREHLWALRATREGNRIVIATRTLALPPRAVLAARAATIEARFGAFGLPARKWLRMLRPCPPLPAAVPTGADVRRSSTP
ncbi:MAG: spermidine synthase [Rubrivivax sp.]